jgi:Flp pilus assembly protein TadG
MMSLSRLRQVMTLKVRTFIRDAGGVSTIEFAFVAPILILAYLGMADVTMGMMASRRTSHLAATIGDLAAQSETLTSANITDLWAIANSMMQPFPTTPTAGQPSVLLKMRITSVKMNAAGTSAEVQWSRASNWTRLTDDAAEIKAIKNTQIAAGESLIVTDVEYTYDSPIKAVFVKDGTIFNNTFYHHPRNGAAVVCSGC